MKSILFFFSMFTVLFLALLFLPACDGDGPGEVDDLWYHLFDTEFSWVLGASPPYFTTDTPVDISITVRPRESGVGHFTIVGNNPDNGADGTMISPVTGEVGSLNAPVIFEAGQPTQLTWRIQLNETDRQSVRFTFFANFDSVMVDTVMYPLGAPELSAAFGSGYLPGFSTLFHINPEE